jgi:hypothetical protein
MSLILNISGYDRTLTARETEQDCVGECEALATGDYDIRVSPHLKDPAFVEVTIHELIEAINMIYDLELPHSSIQTLGVALGQLMPHDQLGPYLRAAMAPEKPKEVKKRKKKT